MGSFLCVGRTFLSIKSLVFFLGMITFIGCGGGRSNIPTVLEYPDDRLVETRGPVEYKDDPPPEDGFIGLSGIFADESQARADADLNARRQIVQSLGIAIDIETVNRVMMQGATGDIISGDVFNTQKTHAVAEGILAVRAEGHYVEKWSRYTSSGIEYYYKVWCLMLYPRSEHHRLMTKMVESLMQVAEPLMIKAEAAKRQGRIKDALSNARRVREWTAELDGYSGIPLDQMNRVRRLLARAEDITQGITLLVVISEKVGELPVRQRQFEPRLAEALTRRNVLTVRSGINTTGVEAVSLLSDRRFQKNIARREGADLLLVGTVVVNEPTQHSRYWWSTQSHIDIRLIEPFSGGELWSASLGRLGDIISDTRGFGKSRERAINNALSLSNRREYGDDPFGLLVDEILSTLE